MIKLNICKHANILNILTIFRSLVKTWKYLTDLLGNYDGTYCFTAVYQMFIRKYVPVSNATQPCVWAHAYLLLLIFVFRCSYICFIISFNGVAYYYPKTITVKINLVLLPRFCITVRILINGNSIDHFNKGFCLHKHRTSNNLLQYINLSYLFWRKSSSIATYYKVERLNNI